ncbi:endolytic transglycosylase MltG [Collinsella sp. zg1085]|nr:endolytic transglycosylase MltG [Collinsella sp. zg1085]
MLVLIGVLVVVFVLPRFGQTEKSPVLGTKVEVVIPQGAGGDQIASILAKAHVIDDPKAYYAAVSALNAELSLQPGTYEFEVGQDPESVVKQLMAGSNIQGLKLTIPEGLTVKQTAAKVQEALGISADEFINQAKASNYVGEYPFLEAAVNDSLEGFLFPKTYSFSAQPSADELIRTLLNQHVDEYASFDMNAARNTIKEQYGIEMSDYDFLIMASMIEREALDDEQRYNVASVFYNRLKIGMLLQSDATMGYVTGGPVSAADLRQESPYNTYLNKGLVPTPICAPSLASMKAALNPASTDYIYFFITKDLTRFSRTHEEHEAAIRESKS